jgi:hypothetical protein
VYLAVVVDSSGVNASHGLGVPNGLEVPQYGFAHVRAAEQSFL